MVTELAGLVEIQSRERCCQRVLRTGLLRRLGDVVARAAMLITTSSGTVLKRSSRTRSGVGLVRCCRFSGLRCKCMRVREVDATMSSGIFTSYTEELRLGVPCA